MGRVKRVEPVDVLEHLPLKFGFRPNNFDCITSASGFFFDRPSRGLDVFQWGEVEIKLSRDGDGQGRTFGITAATDLAGADF
jgi:hypothetical protein